MKKSIIAAGAASVALAAMPVVGVFAARTTVPVTDLLSVQLNPTCSLVRSGAVTTDETVSGTSSWDSTAGQYNVVMGGGETDAIIGTTTLHAICNDLTNGFDVTAAFTGLANSGSTQTIDYDGAATPTHDSYWYVEFGASGSQTKIASSGTAVITGAVTTGPAIDGDYLATYKITTSSTQATDTYTGNATYTLTYGPNA